MTVAARAVCLVLPLGCFYSMTALARTWHVPADAPAIQTAIDSSASGDTVLVGPGIYNENIHLLGKNIWLHSEAGPDVTSIDGSSLAESVVLINSSETSACVLEGFTITGGKGHVLGANFYGGGVLIYNASPIFRNNVIRENETEYGGGVFIGGNDPLNDYSKV